VGRKKRVEIFFILYLSAVVGFVLITKEQEHLRAGFERRMTNLMKTFLAPVTIEFESDTLYCYVSADASGILSTRSQQFSTNVLVRDIGPDDSIAMKLVSISRNDVLISPNIVKIGERRGLGTLGEMTVFFPLSIRLMHTGTYNLKLHALTNRIHPAGGGKLRYRTTVFDSTIISDVMHTEVENSIADITLIVLDTAVVTSRSVEPLRMVISQPEMNTVFGREVENALSVNHAWFEPVVRIISGPGRIEHGTSTSSQAKFFWKGAISTTFDSVVLESRIDRKAGGKDIARGTFFLHAQEPMLIIPYPSNVYAGEDLSCNVSVTGLGIEKEYSWQLFEISASNVLVKKASGVGPQIQYHIPNNFSGKRLFLVARYQGKEYQYIHPLSYQKSDSRFEWRVNDAPIQIRFSPTGHFSASRNYRFSVSQFSDPKYNADNPLSDLSEVSVTLAKANGTNLRVLVERLNAPGQFQFMIENKNLLASSGEMVTVFIRAHGQEVQKTIMMFRD